MAEKITDTDRDFKELEEYAEKIAVEIYSRIKKEAGNVGELKRRIQVERTDFVFRKSHLAIYLFERIDRLLNADIAAIQLQ